MKGRRLRAVAGQILAAMRQAAWAPVLVVAAYALATVTVGEDATLPWLDMVAHSGGGFALAYFFATLLERLQAVVGATPRGIRLLAAVGLTAIAAIAWELLEHAADRLGGARFAPDLPDTLLDLALGVAGGCAYAAAHRERTRTVQHARPDDAGTRLASGDDSTASTGAAMGKRTGHSRPEERADERADRLVGGSEEPPTSRPDDAGSPLPAQQTPPGRPPNASPTPGKDQRRNRAA